MTTTCQKNLVFGVHTSVLSSVSHMSAMSGKSGFWSLYTSTCKPHVKRIWSLKSVHLRFSPSQVVTTCLKDPEFGVRICLVSPMAHLATTCPKKQRLLLQSSSRSSKSSDSSLTLRARPPASFLFSCKDSMSIDLDSVYWLDMNGFEELASINASFSQYTEALFSETSKDF